MDWIIDRLDEPSTYNGLAGFALALGLSQQEFTAIASIVAGVFALVGALKKEGKI